MKKHLLPKIFFSVLLLFLINGYYGALHAQDISSPYNLKVNGTYLNGSTTLTFKWKLTDYQNLPTGFRIYAASGETRELENFDLLYTINSNSDSLYYSDGNDSTRFIRLTITIGNQQMPVGVYSFYIVSFEDGSVSEPSNIVIIRIAQNESPKIKFTSTPVKSVKVNHDYRYDANAQANVDGTILFRAIEKPDSMVLVESTGVMEWRPSEPGRYRVTIQAYLQNDTSVYQNQTWEIWVLSCEDLCVIWVKVTNQNDQLVNGGSVKVYYMDNDSLVFLYAGQIKNGWFAHDGLDAGTYYLYFYGGGENNVNYFYNEWYEDSESFDNATPIVLSCGDRDTVEAQVETLRTYTYYRITGVVRRQKIGRASCRERV